MEANSDDPFPLGPTNNAGAKEQSSREARVCVVDETHCSLPK
jgi:hypothetical protein